MNDKVSILQLSYGNYVSADDYLQLQSNWNSLREWLEKVSQEEPMPRTEHLIGYITMF